MAAIFHLHHEALAVQVAIGIKAHVRDDTEVLLSKVKPWTQQEPWTLATSSLIVEACRAQMIR